LLSTYIQQKGGGRGKKKKGKRRFSIAATLPNRGKRRGGVSEGTRVGAFLHLHWGKKGKVPIPLRKGGDGGRRKKEREKIKGFLHPREEKGKKKKGEGTILFLIRNATGEGKQSKRKNKKKNGTNALPHYRQGGGGRWEG